MLTELTYENDIAFLSLNNPKLNVLSSEFVAEIYERIVSIEKDAKVLIVKSSLLKTFSAGADVREIHDNSYESAYLNAFIDHTWEAIANVKIPVIAAVSGYALGGGFELALMCDIVVASKNAVFGFPEVSLSVMPGMGGTQFLTRAVGTKIASEILMTGRFVKADEALKLGLINYITENDSKMLEKATDIAKEISKKSTMSVRMIKEAIRLSQEIGISQGIKSERGMFRSLFSTNSKQKDTERFLEKRS